MIPLPSKAYLIAGAVVLGGLLFWQYHQSVWNSGYDQAVLENAEKERDALVIYANKIKEAQETHDANQETIDTLRAASSSRVRFKFAAPKCTTSDADEANRILSERISDTLEAIRRSDERTSYECDKLNNAAIRANQIANPE